jgi:hypothetical protein
MNDNEREAMLKLVELALAGSVASARINAIIDRVRAGGPEVTISEIDALSLETGKRRARWDEVTK